jgi:RNA polymerase sigma-70 factor (ECF subfamily)
MDARSGIPYMISEESQRETFARLFAQHHRWLYAYLMSILADFSSTEEVFQEVCVVLWREFGKFDPETDFRRWASVIARHKVYQFRQARARHGRCLTNEVLELIAEEALVMSDLLEQRRAALHHCLAKLKGTDRELIAACYSETSRNFKQVAEQLRRPVNTVYKGLQRIRRVLRECIRRRIAVGG